MEKANALSAGMIFKQLNCYGKMNIKDIKKKNDSSQYKRLTSA
jgi:hypothetical protein